MPAVSVIIPTYNRRELVREALASVLAQTHGDVELIVVDDGSDDGTAEVVQEFARVRYVYQPNRGVSAARNHGVALSSGALLAFLDSDDLWQPRKLESQVAFFTAHPQALICQTEEIWLRHGVRVNPHNKHRKPAGDIFARSLELCLVSPSAVMLLMMNGAIGVRANTVGVMAVSQVCQSARKASWCSGRVITARSRSLH